MNCIHLFLGGVKDEEGELRSEGEVYAYIDILQEALVFIRCYASVKW
jgi:hypothetical protein